MSSLSTVSYNNIKRKGSDFSFTKKLADYARNDKWVESYKASIGEDSNDSSLSSMWRTVRVGTEDIGNEIYTKIKNFIDEIGNIDTCTVEQLRHYAEILGVENDCFNINFSFPTELCELVDIFSVNRAYLYNKAIGTDEQSAVLKNSILCTSTVEEFSNIFKDDDEFKALIQNSIYNTIMYFLNLKNVTFDSSKDGIETTEIWRTDMYRFTNRIWSDDIESDSAIYNLKNTLGVDKSFTEKIYANDIIEGTRKLSDFSDIEQVVLNEEIESRKTRYSDAHSMSYYYVRFYKVLEYFRFVLTVYTSAYTLEDYDIDETKFIIDKDLNIKLIKFTNGSYEIDTDIIKKISIWISNYAISIARLRTDMRSQCKRNTMAGTKRIIIDTIRKFILDTIDNSKWLNISNDILRNAGLNTDFNISLVEYIDTTDYTNIETESDVATPSDFTTHSRFWENYDDLGNAIDNEAIRKFFNRLHDDGLKFKSNSSNDSGDSSNLYEFLSVLFQTGATDATAYDYSSSTTTYSVVGDTTLNTTSESILTDDEKSVLAKYSGDETVGVAPYANDKNTLHPSYQIMPFIQGFEEYDNLYSQILNVIDTYSDSINESIHRLSKRIDKFGNTINFWYSWNNDFTGYTTTRETVNNAYSIDDYTDSPYNMDALNEFIIYKDTFINKLLEKENTYYVNHRTGSMFLDDNEINLEVSRLNRYYDDIKRNANRTIYKYFKDIDGNIYILYKSKEDRNNRNALGDIWVRMKNHPIAFPLFDIDSTLSDFSSTSSITECENQKLRTILNKIVSRFESTYGKHNIDNSVADGDVTTSNFGVVVGTYSKTLPILKDSLSKTTSAQPIFDYIFKDFEITDGTRMPLVGTENSTFNNAINGIKFKTVYSISDIPNLEKFKETYYYIDSITNEVLESDDLSEYEVVKENGTQYERVLNETGKLLNEPDSRRFYAEYNSDINSLTIYNVNSSVNNELLFVEYSDDLIADASYYCQKKSHSSTDNVKHPCTKHKITINRLFKINPDALAGTVSEEGNVSFDTLSGNGYFNSTCDTIVESTSGMSIVDGGIVTENFDIYSYYIRDVVGQKTTDVDRSDIIFLGGSNPYYVYYDSNNVLKLRRAFIKENQISDFDAYNFSDDIYRTDVKSVFTASYSVSDCIMKTTYGDKYSDTYGQFALRSNPYQTYSVYTEVTGEPFEDRSKIDNNLPIGQVTIRDKFGKDHAFYYNLSVIDTEAGTDKFIRTKALKYNQYTETLNITGSKFTGNISLKSTDTSKKPITLAFNDESQDNVAVFTTLNNRYSQEKFYDMGISYNKKILYLSYYNERLDYSNGGTIYGSVHNSYDENNCTILALNTINMHNVEYYDSESFCATKFLSDGRAFHIGDCPTKSGCISVFARQKYKVDEYNPNNESTKNTATYKLIEQLEKSNIVDATKEFVLNNMYDSLFIGLLISHFRGYECESIITRYFDKEIFDDLLNLLDIDNGLNSVVYDYVKSASPNLELNFVIANSDTIETTKIDIAMKYGMYLFNEGSLFSANVNTMSDKIFVSLTTIGPEKNDIFITSAGGKFEFSDISNSKSDSIITILPFTINNNTSVVYDESGVKYIMENGSIGYLSQFYGIDGKNTLFTNKSLSAGTSFAFELGCNPGTVETYDDLFEVRNCTVPDGYDFSSNSEIYKFVGLDSENNSSKNITGVIITSDGLDTYILSSSTSGGSLTPITDHDCLVYDVTRKHNGVLFFAESNTSGPYTCALKLDDKENDETKPYTKVKIPVVSDIDGYYTKSFAEFEDYNDSVYALSQYKDSIVRMYVDDVLFTPVEGINKIRFYPNENVEHYSDLENVISKTNGYIVRVSEAHENDPAGSCYIFNDNNWILLEVSALDNNDGIKLSEYENSSLMCGSSRFALKNNPYIIFFGAYSPTNKVIAYSPTRNRQYSYKTIPFFIDNVPYVFEFSQITISDGIRTAIYNVKRVEEDGSLSQVIITDGKNNRINHTVKLDWSDPIKGIVNTRVKNGDNDNDKIIFTERGGIYKYTFGNNNLELTSSLDEVIKTSGITDYDMNVDVYEAVDHLLIRYTINNLDRSGFMWVRKNTPTSIATFVNISDSDGNSIKSGVVSTVLTINTSYQKLIVMEDDNGFIYRSNDDGESFKRIDTGISGLHLIGCGYNSIYAEKDGVKFSSYDGIIWTNCGELSVSEWVVFGVNGIDYCACSKIDSEYASGVIDINKRIVIDRQIKLPETYDGIKIFNNILVAYTNSDGTGPFTVYRQNLDSTESEIYSFSNIKSIPVGNMFAYDNNMFMMQDSGDRVIVIDDVFDMMVKPTVRMIDLTEYLPDVSNIYGKFNVTKDRLLLVPTHGRIILEYDDNIGIFRNLYSFDSNYNFSDVDPISSDENSDIIITTRNINSYGELTLYISTFEKQRDYGLVEIDSGFPIAVSYVKSTTKFRSDGTTYDVYFITFVMINDLIKRSVTIMTKPDVDTEDLEIAKDIFDKECSKTISYTSGSRVLRYTFSTVDSKQRYIITKTFSRSSANTIGEDYFSVSYTFPSDANRDDVILDYELSEGLGEVSIYGGFDSKYEQYVEQLN